MDSGFQVSTGFQFLSLELEFRIPIVSGIPDSLSSILDTKPKISDLQDIFSRIPDCTR